MKSFPAILVVMKVTISMRFLQKTDEERLLQYFTQLSAETKSRFGPHPFDRDTVKHICNEQRDGTTRYIALDARNNLMAYMLVKKE